MAIFRPSLSIPAGNAEEEALAAVEGLIDSGRCAGQSAGAHVSVTVPRNERSFWSPWLHLEYDAEAGTFRGWAGPSPSIWTAFMLAQLALLTLTVGAAIWWLAQRSIGGDSVAGWVTLGALCASIALFAAGQFGRIRAQEQQDKLIALIAHELGARSR